MAACLFVFVFRSRQLELEDKQSTLELELRKYMEINGMYWCAHTHTHTHVQHAKDATDVFANVCVFQCVTFLPLFSLRLAEADSRLSRFIDLLISLFVFFSSVPETDRS